MNQTALSSSPAVPLLFVHFHVREQHTHLSSPIMILSSDLFDSHLDLDTCLDTESRRHIGMLGVPCRRPDDCA